jgi:hypothetical protein
MSLGHSERIAHEPRSVDCLGPVRQKLHRRDDLVYTAQARRAAEADLVPDILWGHRPSRSLAVSVLLVLSPNTNSSSA